MHTLSRYMQDKNNNMLFLPRLSKIHYMKTQFIIHLPTL